MVDVAIIGGGIGGLTAGQELAERGCSVTIYEADEACGGKARSIPRNGPASLPGEHGFRFFPAFYRHVTDTMGRIPDEGGTVGDHLVETDRTLIAGIRHPDRFADTRQSTSIRGWLEAFKPPLVEDMPPRDIGFVLERLLYLLTSCQRRRETELESISWWEFMEAERRSQAFRHRLSNATQALVALDPRYGSARAIGIIYLQLLLGRLDPSRPTERILDAPSSVAWFDPWVAHLASIGVRLRSGATARRLSFDGRDLTEVELDDGSRIEADEFVLAVPVDVAPSFVTPELAEAAPTLDRIDRLETAWMAGIQYYLSDDVTITRGHQIYAESPWALTSISQRQFWTGYDFGDHAKEGVEGVLSVIVSDWETPGMVHDKPAKRCTREEIAEEVWEQLKAHLNTGGETLRDGMLVEWFLDPAIVETEDGVTNRSPLLINTVGSLPNRPPADSGIRNLTMASDYVRTHTDLPSMEAANEAGRRAANAIIDRHRLPGGRARVWELQEPAVFEPFKRQDEILYRLGQPHPMQVSRALESVASDILEEP